MIITFNKVSENIKDITPEQIGKCSKFYDFSTKQNYYLVENSQGILDDEGNAIEYRITYVSARGFGCTCESGKRGFANVKHASGVCWHIRASVAAMIEERAALAELTAATKNEHCSLIIAGKPATEAERERILNAPTTPTTRAKVYQPKAFSLLH